MLLAVRGDARGAQVAAKQVVHTPNYFEPRSAVKRPAWRREGVRCNAYCALMLS